MPLPTPSASPNDIASQRRVSLSTVTQGKGRLYRVEKFDSKPDGKTTVATEMGTDEGAGFIDEPGGHTVTFDLMEQQGNSWPDWDALVAGKEIVTVTDQIIGGRRWAYGPGRVSSVSRSGDKAGAHNVSVEIVALGRKAMS